MAVGHIFLDKIVTLINPIWAYFNHFSSFLRKSDLHCLWPVPLQFLNKWTNEGFEVCYLWRFYLSLEVSCPRTKKYDMIEDFWPL